MKYGIYLPNFGDQASPQVFAELAQLAEETGWDGVFLWDHMLYSKNQKVRMFDPWICLAAMAAATQQIRMGTTVTPVARRRPTKLARETASLDILSGGRLILGAGLGDPPDVDFSYFGDESDARLRAARLDEGLQILNGLWQDKPFVFQGEHFKIEKSNFLPTPIQKPRIPIWIGGFLPNPKPVSRAAKWDGMIPLKRGGAISPADIEELSSKIREQRDSEMPFDIAVIATRKSLDRGTPKGVHKINNFQDAGMTWWLESLFGSRHSTDALREAITRGPPA